MCIRDSNNSGHVGIKTDVIFNGALLSIGNGQGANMPTGEHIKIAPSANTITFLDGDPNTSDTANIQFWNTVYNNSSAKIELYHPAANTGGIKLHTHDGTSLKERLRITSEGQVQFSNGSFSDNIDSICANGGTMEIGAQSTLKFRTATNETLRITSNGVLQIIGQTSTLETAGLTHHTNNNLYIRGGTTGAILQSVDGNEAFIVQNDYVSASTNGVERFRIDSSGSVGIGTDNPTQESGKGLHIANTTANAQARIHLTTEHSGHTINDGFYIVAQGGESIGFEGDVLFQNKENKAIKFSTNNIEKLRITNDGHLIPFAGSNYNIGASGTTFANGYFDTIHATNISGTIGSPGSNKEILFNNSGVIAGSSNFTWDTSNNDFNVSGNTIFGGAGGDTATDPLVRLNNSSSDSFNHSLQIMTANLAAGETNVVAIGKETNDLDSAYIGYRWYATDLSLIHISEPTRPY